jgi:hypothetical protein
MASVDDALNLDALHKLKEVFEASASRGLLRSPAH